MRVAVIGATGNVGTSVVDALGRTAEVGEIVGIARRRPDWSPAKTTWVEADILETRLEELLIGVDAVIHLAWAIQPSRDEAMMERINVEGTRRVIDAVAAAGVPKLVYASSVGAYSPGPKDSEVDESWPTEGIETSFYARHKVATERMLDVFEREGHRTKVVRIRPALIFKGEAATEIRRLFAGPFLPGNLLRSRFVPVLPRIRGLRFQAVHSLDVADAYALAVVRDAQGAFNVAADPPIGPEELADVFNARLIDMPASVVRRLTDLSWRLRLQPTPPGWLDMALAVPLMSSARARRELGWEPRHTSLDALRELLWGMREGEGFPTPPLEEDSAARRAREIGTGVGARQGETD